jgi:toxin ParE1/3/4
MANKKIEFHAEAVSEIRTSLDWYFQRSQTAARKFSDELLHALEQIQRNPRRWPLHLAETRRFFLPHFPFAIVYKEFSSLILIVAVAHGHRKPDY